MMRSSLALDALGRLPEDWTTREALSLLSRPLFDGAAYGHIRFHHRRVAEYLASLWIRRRISEGCPTSVLKDFVTCSDNGGHTLRRGLVPVTAWL